MSDNDVLAWCKYTDLEQFCGHFYLLGNMTILLNVVAKYNSWQGFTQWDIVTAVFNIYSNSITL